MTSEDLERALGAAASKTLDRMRQDRARASWRVEPLLAAMERHLFDPDLQVKTMLGACGITDNTVSTRFHAELGLAPYAYVTDSRMETAARLLRDTEISITGIGEMLGYSSLRAFSVTFADWFGLRPRVFRHRSREVGRLAPPAAGELDCAELERRALAGDLDRAEAARLLERLEAVYGREDCEPEAERPVKIRIDGRALEAQRAQEIWESIRDLPWDEQCAVVRDQHEFTTRAMFDLLRRKSREEGRRERRRGIDVARLALESLRGSAQTLGEQLPELEALAWATIGNARRLALDFAGAEHAFDKAEQQWRLLLKTPDPLVEAEIWCFKAGLRQFERRFGEALELVDHAIEICDPIAGRRLRVIALLLRANILGYTGEYEANLADLREALELLDERDRPLRLGVYHSQATTHMLQENFEAAAEILPLIEPLITISQQPNVRLQILWLEGLVRCGQGETLFAERRLAEVRASYVALGESDHAAVVGLDLALLYLEQGRPREALPLVCEAMALYERLGIHRESLAALRLFHTALEDDRVTRVELDRFRAALSHLRRELVAAPGGGRG